MSDYSQVNRGSLKLKGVKGAGVKKSSKSRGKRASKSKPSSSRREEEHLEEREEEEGKDLASSKRGDEEGRVYKTNAERRFEERQKARVR